jgi:hypothetical protein
VQKKRKDSAGSGDAASINKEEKGEKQYGK